MFSYLIALVLGAVQGAASVLPVSALGHSLAVAELFGWSTITSQAAADSSHFLTLYAASQVSIGLSLAVYYRHLWWRIGRSLLRPRETRSSAQAHEARFAHMLLLSAALAGAIALLLDHALRTAFARVSVAIILFCINGVMLLRGDRTVPTPAVPRSRSRRVAAARRDTYRRTLHVVADHIALPQAKKVGVLQVFALLPGISQSGLIMIAGIKQGLQRGDAVAYAMLLLTPLLIVSGAPRLPHLFTGTPPAMQLKIAAAAAVAACTAVAAAAYLNRIVKKHGLQPFGWYTIGLGLFLLVMAIIRGSVQK